MARAEEEAPQYIAANRTRGEQNGRRTEQTEDGTRGEQNTRRTEQAADRQLGYRFKKRLLISHYLALYCQSNRVSLQINN